MADILATDAEQMDLEELEELDGGEGSSRDEGMSDSEFLTNVQAVVSDSEQWIQQDVSPGRIKGMRYYNGECDLPSQKNRSAFVMRVVRDTVEQTIPQLMRIFTGGVDIVAFRSDSMDPQAQRWAKDATDAVNDVFWNKNPGWENVQDFARDALKAKMGVFQVENREVVTVREEEFSGPREQLEVILDNDSVDVVEYSSEFIDVPAQGVAGVLGLMDSVEVVDATLRITERKLKTCVEAVPSEELLVDRGATSLEPGKFRMVGRKQTKTVSELVEMGIDEGVAEKYAGTDTSSATGDYAEQERRARRGAASDPNQDWTNTDKSTQPVAYYQIYLYADKDGDGIAELRCIKAVGEGPAEIVEDMVVQNHILFASPAIPVEHNVIGESLADNLMDLQDVETQITRQTLDNLVLVNNPRRKGIKGQYDKATLQSNSYNSVIDVKHPDALTWDHTPFIGDKALLVREAFNETKAERTGITKESMGLDAQNFKDSVEVGVLAVLGAGQTQPDMIAATMAHRAFVPMARQIVRLLKEAAQGEMTIKARGEYRQVNPAEWPDDMELEVMVGLGTGNRDENIAALQYTAGQQRTILEGALAATGDLQNPWVTPGQMAYTLHRITQLSGTGPSTDFFNSPDMAQQIADQMSAAKANAPQQPPESVQTATIKAQSDQATAHTKAQADLQKAEIGASKDLTIQEMQDRMDTMARNQEYILALLKMSQGDELSDSDTNINESGS